MARAHYTRPVLDEAGNLIPDLVLRVIDPDTGVEVPDVYLVGVGGNPVTQPFQVATGIISIYLPLPKRVRLGVVKGTATEVFFEDVDVLVPADPVGPSFSSTHGEGLPTTTDRLENDLHYDQTSQKEYILIPGEPVAAGFSDDFNRSNRVLGGDNGWTALDNSVTSILDNTARVTQRADFDAQGVFQSTGQYSFLNYGNGHAGVSRPQAAGADGLITAQIDAKVVVADGGADASLFIGATGVGTQNISGVEFLWNDGGNFDINEVNADGTVTFHVNASDPFDQSPFENLNVFSTYLLTYNPTTRVAIGYRNGVEKVRATLTRNPPGTLTGFVSQPDFSGAPPQGEFYMDNWVQSGAAGAAAGLEWVSTDEAVAPHTHPAPPASGGSGVQSSLITGAIFSSATLAQSGVDVYAPLGFDTDVFDFIGIHNPLVNPDRFTPPSAGVYKFTIQVAFETAGGGVRFVAARKNGQQPTNFTSSTPIADHLEYAPVHLTAIYELLATDFIQVMVEIRDVTSPSGVNGEDRLTYVIVEKLA